MYTLEEALFRQLQRHLSIPKTRRNLHILKCLHREMASKQERL